MKSIQKIVVHLIMPVGFRAYSDATYEYTGNFLIINERRGGVIRGYVHQLGDVACVDFEKTN